MKEKSRRDDSHRLEYMKALECKLRYENLKDDCKAEKFLDIAHETARALKNVAKGLSPDSSNRLMSASFTPRKTSSSWHHQNFPEPINKPKFVIGCETNPADKH